MKTRNEIKNITLSAMFLALAFVMPFLTGQIPQIGSMLCPMQGGSRPACRKRTPPCISTVRRLNDFFMRNREA